MDVILHRPPVLCPSNARPRLGSAVQHLKESQVS